MDWGEDGRTFKSDHHDRARYVELSPLGHGDGMVGQYRGCQRCAVYARPLPSFGACLSGYAVHSASPYEWYRFAAKY